MQTIFRVHEYFRSNINNDYWYQGPDISNTHVFWSVSSICKFNTMASYEVDILSEVPSDFKENFGTIVSQYYEKVKQTDVKNSRQRTVLRWLADSSSTK